MTALEVAAVGPAADAVSRHVGTLAEQQFASRLFAMDATLWGPEAEAEASIRLGWVALHRSSRPLLGWARYRMPVEGLYLAGSGAHPGGGVTGMPGRNAAREVIADRKRLRR